MTAHGADWYRNAWHKGLEAHARSDERRSRARRITHDVGPGGRV
jgi:hypothetical protein